MAQSFLAKANEIMRLPDIQSEMRRDARDQWPSYERFLSNSIGMHDVLWHADASSCAPRGAMRQNLPQKFM